MVYQQYSKKYIIKIVNFVTKYKVIRHIHRGGKSDAGYGANL